MKNQSWRNGCWQLGLVSCVVVGGAIAISGEYASAEVPLGAAASQMLCPSTTDLQNPPCSSSPLGGSGFSAIDVGPQPGNPNGHDGGQQTDPGRLLAPGVIQQQLVTPGAIQQQPLLIPGAIQQQFNAPRTGNW